MLKISARLIPLFILLLRTAQAQVTVQESERSAKIIGMWLSRSTGHYDFQSATSVNPKRAGNKFFGIPDMQTASDYGFSYSQAQRPSEVTDAFKTIGADTSSMASSLKTPRFHLNLGFANTHDFNFSYIIPSDDKIKGWGIGYKNVFVKLSHFFVAYRIGYARSYKENYFSAATVSNDLSASLYLRLIDLYAGLRHWSGKVSFESSIPQLQLPSVNYFSTASQLEPYFGIIAATTTRTRLTVETSSSNEAYTVSGKFSFHFDSLLPTADNWFRDPRYIKQ